MRLARRAPVVDMTCRAPYYRGGRLVRLLIPWLATTCVRQLQPARSQESCLAMAREHKVAIVIGRVPLRSQSVKGACLHRGRMTHAHTCP